MAMPKGRKMYALYLYFVLNFVATGMGTFAPKFYGEIGLSDGRIGLISSVMAVAAMFFQPFWGMIADRARYKRTVLAAALVMSGGACFLVLPATRAFFPMLAVLTLYSIFYLPAMPVGNAIAIEYTSAHHRSFGPVRMMGTVGYQVGILATGLLLTHSLHGLYPAMGAMLLVTALSTLLMPKVQGHQHTRERVPLTVLLKNRELVLILIITFLAHIGHQFNLAFFSKYLGDLGIGNTVTGVITTLAVALEIPFLLVGDRLMKRLSIWRWMTVGLMLGAVRFSLLAVVKAPALIVLAQTLSIAHLACFEFFPMVYLGRSVGENLQASCQSVLQMVSFGFARIIASLVGGLLADATGIPGVYGMCGALMLATSLALLIPLERRARADKEQGVL